VIAPFASSRVSVLASSPAAFTSVQYLQWKADTLAGVCGALLAVRAKKRNAALLVSSWRAPAAVAAVSAASDLSALCAAAAARQW